MNMHPGCTVTASRFLSCGGVALALFIATTSGCGQKAKPAPPEVKPVNVLYVCPVQRTVTEHAEFSGRAWALETVEIRARVDGYLNEVKFEDGDDVEAGKVLFEIEDDTFRAELERAKAAVIQAKAQHDRLKSQLDRAKKLFASNTASAEQVETLTFQTNEADASHAAAVAARDLAQLNVDYTRVKSPIHGRMSRRLVDKGNLIKADDTLLANVVSLDPIYAYFDFDERTVISMRKLVEEGKLDAAPDMSKSVEIMLAGEEKVAFEGKINWVDNQVDVGTGTLRSRVKIDNPKHLLSPGMFVRLRVPVGPSEQALLLPEEALGSDQGLRFVYVVGKDNVVERRDVEIGWLTGNLRVVRKNINADDKVIVTNLQRLKAGVTKVEPKERGTPEEQKTAETAVKK